MKNVAVVGCTVTLSPGDGVKQITTQASLKVKADGKGVYFGPIDVAVSGYSDSVITVPLSGSGTITIQPSAQKVKVEGKYVILEGDSGSAMINGMAQQGQTQVPVQSNVTAKIEVAGQVKVKAN
jgi:hypothetical protein